MVKSIYAKRLSGSNTMPAVHHEVRLLSCATISLESTCQLCMTAWLVAERVHQLARGGVAGIVPPARLDPPGYCLATRQTSALERLSPTVAKYWGP
jgi:hypothetical protein